MADLTAVRNGVKARLATIVGLNGYAIEPASPVYPSAWVFPRGANYHTDYDGTTLWTLAVTVMVAATDHGRAQSNLDPYLAPAGLKSVRQALEEDQTLGGVAEYVVVRSFDNYFAQDIAGSKAVGAQFQVEVLA